MVRNADSIENAIGPKWPGGRYARGFGGTDEPQRSQRTQSVSCDCGRDVSWQAGKSVERRTADILSARRPRDTSNSSCANEIIYCGYRFDPETQLYYVRNRTYSPVLGRWIQRDPIGYDGGINLYGYVGDHPVAATDPTGNIWQWVHDIWDFFTGVTPGGESVEGAEANSELASKGGWCLPAHLRREHDLCLETISKRCIDAGGDTTIIRRPIE